MAQSNFLFSIFMQFSAKNMPNNRLAKGSGDPSGPHKKNEYIQKFFQNRNKLEF